MLDTKNGLPPHNPDAEEAVIGSLLIGGDINLINLSPDDFYHEVNGVIYEACTKLSGRDEGINQITLAQELSQQGKLDEVGGAAYLSYLISICPTHLDLPHYAEIVRRLAMFRKLITVGQRIMDLGYKASSDITATLSKADDLLLEMRKQTVSMTIIAPEDRANMMVDRYTKLYKADTGIAIKTGLVDLDEWLGGGLYGGEVIIVGARTGMGKTAFLQSMANYIGQTSNVLFFSDEMNVEGLTDRDVAGIVGVTTDKVRLGGYSDELYSDIIGLALDEIGKKRLYFCDDTPLTTDKIMQTSLSMRLRQGLDVVFVDYLGLLDDKEGENQNLRLGHISRRLKYIARKLDIPVVVAHQLSRAVELRSSEEKRPRLADLRESGHIEEDADVVLFLYRDSYYQDSQDGTTEVIIAKQRQGQANKIVKVFFDRQHQTYRNLAKKAKAR